MPNWVQNNIKFSGDTAEIKKMLEAIKNDEISFGSIDFNKIIPMPESLNIECCSITNKGIEMVKNYLESMPEELKGKEGTYEEFIRKVKERIDWNNLQGRMIQAENEAISAAIDTIINKG